MLWDTASISFLAMYTECGSSFSSMLFTVRSTIESASTSSIYSLSIKSISLLSFVFLELESIPRLSSGKFKKLPNSKPTAIKTARSNGMYIFLIFIIYLSKSGMQTTVTPARSKNEIPELSL